MYENIDKIGEKLKSFANILGISGTIISAIVGIIFIFNLSSFIYAIIGAIATIIFVFVFRLLQFIIYGFGELVDQSIEINKSLISIRNQNNE